MQSKPETRIQELHITLLQMPKPKFVYKPTVRVGNLLYVSGHGPLKPDGKMIVGRLGQDMTVEQGKEAARQVGIAVLSTVKEALGSLNKVKRLVKTLGWVSSTNDFFDHPSVMNGWSEFMKEVFGEDAGVGVRSAIGTNVLPGGMAVEVECIFEIEE